MKVTTAKEYIDMKSDVFPHTTKWGLELSSSHLYCPRCKGEASDLKHQFVDFDKVTTIRVVGICKKCNLITENKPLKIYSDDRVMWYEEKYGWVTQHVKRGGWIKRFFRFLKKMIVA